ncbi:unnamed protein product [Trichogramma brassicae]|uniref:Troponin T n=1 Tax=Trichogramma brassicae TaxID=86971 RepID=A0A6H5I417_9HYME|nr:unnamed protein product [Trichogramma brassicae]
MQKMLTGLMYISRGREFFVRQNHTPPSVAVVAEWLRRLTRNQIPSGSPLNINLTFSFHMHSFCLLLSNLKIELQDHSQITETLKITSMAKTHLHFFVAAHTKPPQPCRTRNNILAAKRKLKRSRRKRKNPKLKKKKRLQSKRKLKFKFMNNVRQLIQEQKRVDLDEQLKDYISDWRKHKLKEEEELKILKERQAKRKVSRAEEEKRLAQKKKEEEERRLREIEEKKQRDIEEKRRRLEESEKKRQAMLQALKDQTSKKGPNFVIQKKNLDGNLSLSQLERNKTKEQLEEEKRISLSIRIKPLPELEYLGMEKLRLKAQELWDQIVKLETEKYDLEEREKRQDYDLKELKERQKQQLRHKALKKGLDPEALTGKHPPKIQLASKYERRVDIRSYDDKKKLFDGGLTEALEQAKEKAWSSQTDQFLQRQKSNLPKWFGERPGKKKDDPESPENEEDAKADELEEPKYDSEEEKEESEEEEVSEKEESEEKKKKRKKRRRRRKRRRKRKKKKRRKKSNTVDHCQYQRFILNLTSIYQQLSSSFLKYVMLKNVNRKMLQNYLMNYYTFYLLKISSEKFITQ